MVQTGVLRAFGGDLRRFLMTGLDNRLKAFSVGLGVTALLQSSTAAGLMTTSFITNGLIGLSTAIAVVLGANVGTTLIVQLLTFDISAVSPVLILGGLIAFKRGQATRSRDLGRVVIGLGLLLLALHLVAENLKPVENTRALKDLFALLSSDPLMNILVAAVLTWAAHSSVAILLFVMSLAASGVVSAPAALALVLGANLGSVIPQYFAVSDNTDARRLIVASLIIRLAGCLATLPFLPAIAGLIAGFDNQISRQVADFHTLFNLALAVFFIVLVEPLARLCIWLLPAPRAEADPGKPRYIDIGEVGNPAVALSSAAREVLRMIDIVETMLRYFMDALRSDDRKRLGDIAAQDDVLDRLHNAIKLHLTRISAEAALSEADAKRCSEILSFTINLEHIGDILDKSLRELAAKKIKNRLKFSAEGASEIEAMHDAVLDNLKLATSVFISGDHISARRLLDEKLRMRDLEATVTENHLRRLREGRPESLETSTLHIDIARDLKRITAHVTVVAYPILEAQGVLIRSRLRADAAAEPAHEK